MVDWSKIQFDKQFLIIFVVAIAIVLLLVLSQNVEIPTVTNETQTQVFHGSSTTGKCTSADDCVISGCNAEVCQSKLEKSAITTCVYNPPYPKDKGYNCLCINNQCQWSK